MRGIAGTVARLLDRLGLERVDVLGVSWGGALAQELARPHPDRVRRLVLAATSPGLIAVPGDPRVLLRMATPLRYCPARTSNGSRRCSTAGRSARLRPRVRRLGCAAISHPPS